ncbi:MAG: drug/metabolite transporter (DMT)-like permease [Cellvibrionaceae bacterium]|jgi:drug/metabolite transporter (DMT)-like permease
MSSIAAVLIITSAFMHAGWNFISKRRNPSLAFFLIAAASGSLVMSPSLIIHRQVLPHISLTAWGLIGLTGMAQAIYLFGLAGAYKRGDISLAYPLARALPVLMVAGISLTAGNGGDIGRMGLFGMVLITIGCVMLPFPHFKRMRLQEYFSVVYLFALIAAIGTTGYTLLDDQALRLLRESTDIQLTHRQLTLLYISFQTASTFVMAALAIGFMPHERRNLVDILQNRQLFFTSALTGVVIMATYGLVLAALAFVSNVSYVAAFRQLSIPIGAVLGMTLQGEPKYRPKLVGIAIVSIGLIFVGFG